MSVPSKKPRELRDGSSARAVVLFLAAMLAGCSNSPFDIVPVTGTVAYEDGSPIPSDGYRVKFVPQIESPDGKSHAAVATAEVAADGSFDAATTYKYRDGLVRGKHLVYLEIGQGAGNKALVPPEYRSSKKTPLVVDVAESRDLEIRVPKP